jgi:dihydrofolate reductase
MKLTVNEYVTLDGVMQGPGGPDEDPGGGFDRGGWQTPYLDEDFGRIVGGWFDEVDEFLVGRSTYGMLHGFWSKVTDPADPVATRLNSLPKHVVSTTLTDPEWTNTSVIATDVLDAVRALKGRPGRELQVHGSYQLVQTLHNAGLVDEYRVIEFPVVVGTGKRLFDEGSTPSGFTVAHSEVTGVGAVYRVLRPVPFRVGTHEVDGGKNIPVLTD